jgi:hypothetical protein
VSPEKARPHQFFAGTGEWNDSFPHRTFSIAGLANKWQVMVQSYMTTANNSHTCANAPVGPVLLDLRGTHMQSG